MDELKPKEVELTLAGPCPCGQISDVEKFLIASLRLACLEFGDAKVSGFRTIHVPEGECLAAFDLKLVPSAKPHVISAEMFWLPDPGKDPGFFWCDMALRRHPSRRFKVTFA